MAQHSPAAASPSPQKVEALIASYGAGRHDQAERQAQELIRRHPRHPVSWKVLGHVQAQTGRLEQALATLDGGRIGIGAMAVGLAQAALEAALTYAQQRVQFGQPIAHFEAIQFMLSDMASEIEAARLMVYNCARLKDAGLSFKK